ncbi:stress enhanced protein 1, chloroplastic [Elaeis guineensis]|uniref:Stress enhanced protein 1, chloroplastic isoform X2 n=1 Tax=Elaeis guineensis var. tenera TaxID=51953 RepID=A0A6I9SC06_ELAGV|nr:stress enhanced protein 1, chloroplastic isoform X2 [Elaeis guineensis]
MAQALLPSSLLHATAAKSARARPVPWLRPSSKAPELVFSFKRGSPHFFWITSRRRKNVCRAMSVSIRCEQGTKQNNGLDVWLGRLAMVGFATAITVEIATGKGLLENFGFTTPLPTLALVVTALVGVLTVFFIFQSASQD